MGEGGGIVIEACAMKGRGVPLLSFNVLHSVSFTDLCWTVWVAAGFGGEEE
jgi:hypothetical protein